MVLLNNLMVAISDKCKFPKKLVKETDSELGQEMSPVFLKSNRQSGTNQELSPRWECQWEPQLDTWDTVARVTDPIYIIVKFN